MWIFRRVSQNTPFYYYNPVLQLQGLSPGLRACGGCRCYVAVAIVAVLVLLPLLLPNSITGADAKASVRLPRMAGYTLQCLSYMQHSLAWIGALRACDPPS